MRSKRIHSWYERILADLPWGEYAVAVRFKVRRLFCDAPWCTRCIFAERLPGVAAPLARNTVRLADRLTALGLALGGAGGARLGRTLGLGASRNTLLRLIRRAPLPDIATPAALGVGDWALRKRHSYGTSPKREAFAAGSGAFARSARDGAPGAIQVAGRFHLLQNPAEMLQLVFTAHARDLRAVEQARREAVLAERGTVLAPLA